MTPRRVITERDVRAARQRGEQLTIGADDVITPAAADLLHHTANEPGAAAAAAPVQPSAALSGTVVVGADHGGVRMKDALISVIEKLGFTVEDAGTTGAESVDYPVFASRVADAVAAGRAAFGVMVDGAGIGSAMVANKIAGVRAAMCYDVTTAHNAREHNNANVLTLGGTLIGERLAREIVTTFLRTPFSGGRHAKRVAMIDALDGNRHPPGAP